MSNRLGTTKLTLEKKVPDFDTDFAKLLKEIKSSRKVKVQPIQKGNTAFMYHVADWQ